MNSPSPDERTAASSIQLLNINCNLNVLNTVITAYPTGTAVFSDEIHEKLKNAGAAVVVVNADTQNEPREAVDEAVYDHFAANEP